MPGNFRLAALATLTLSLTPLIACNSNDPNSDEEGETGSSSTGEPCVNGENNYVGQDGQCYCEEGFEWCTNDLSDYSCCPVGGDESGSVGDDSSSSSEGESGDGDGDAGDGDGTGGDGDSGSGDGDGDGDNA
jgi:hypothetical protein